MLSREDNELITRVGPGTRMGEVLRRYWMPALMTSELKEPDGEPVRVRLLGENLLAFRDSSGRVGMVDESCPHRLASLWFGRNEENGLRCVYHGWKFDVNGACLEQMNEPQPFVDKVQLKAYPVVELGDVIWTYMGPPEKQPPPPNFDWAMVPPTHREVNKTWEECNWVQALEGGIDTSHAPILHRKFDPRSDIAGFAPGEAFVRGKPPVIEVDFSDYGYRYAGVRSLDDGGIYVRTYHYVMPFTQLRPYQIERGDESNPRTQIAGHMWVPMDDHNCMVWNMLYSFGPVPLTDDERLERGMGHEPWEFHPGTFRKVRNRDNAYLIDRDIQRTGNFTGILGVNTQDHAVQESMGFIVDRSREQLGPADRAVIGMRRLLLDAVKAVESGDNPPGTDESYYNVRAIERVLPGGVDWREALQSEIYPELVGVR
jgi:nitrite reductase/ring-hydroxylating ferredoxin subunit